MVKNPPSNAGDVGSISGRGTKIPHAVGQLSLRATTTEPERPGACASQLERENAHATSRKKPRLSQGRSHVRQLRPDAAKNNKKKL